jgi:hypothetical protein
LKRLFFPLLAPSGGPFRGFLKKKFVLQVTDNQQDDRKDAKFLKKYLVGNEKGCTFAAVFRLR